MIKLSYSCCKNMGSVIGFHNQRIIWTTSSNHGCNCRKRAECQLNNNCLMTNIAYKAVVSAPSKPDKKYFSIAETSFKDRFRNRAIDNCHKKYVNSNDFWKYMWEWKDEKITASIDWNIMSIIHGTPKHGIYKL